MKIPFTAIPEITGDSIRAFRKKHDISQQQLASILNVGVATINRWEKGAKPTGSAASILRAVIAKSVFEVDSATLAFGNVYEIYYLLKGVFDSENEETLFPRNKPAR